MKIVSICLLVCLYASAAYGQKAFRCPPTPKKEKIAIRKAGRFFAEGERLAVKEKYKKAIERYLCSLKMKEHSNTMFNIAQISKLMEDKDPALKLMKKFRTKNPEHPSLTEINQLIDRMEGGDVATEPSETLQEEAVAENEIENTSISDPLETAAKDETAEEVTLTEAPKNNSNKKLKVAGISFVATGGVLTVIGIGTNAGASRAKDDALSATSYSDFNQYDSKHTNLAAGSVVTYLLGAACLSVGIALIVRSKKKSTTQQSSLIVSPFQPGLTLTF